MSNLTRRNTSLIRVLAILRLLHQSGPKSVGELATAFTTSTRTIYRDLSALEELNVPLVRKVNEWDGIRVVRYDRQGPCPVCTKP
jgi:predicted DNA-binding transcriptional regulator YafY